MLSITNDGLAGNYCLKYFCFNPSLLLSTGTFSSSLDKIFSFSSPLFTVYTLTCLSSKTTISGQTLLFFHQPLAQQNIQYFLLINEQNIFSQKTGIGSLVIQVSVCSLHQSTEGSIRPNNYRGISRAHKKGNRSYTEEGI